MVFAVFRHGLVHEYAHLCEKQYELVQTAVSRCDPRAVARGRGFLFWRQLLWGGSISFGARQPECFTRYNLYELATWTKDDFHQIILQSGDNIGLFQGRTYDPAFHLQVVYWACVAVRSTVDDLAPWMASLVDMEEMTKHSCPVMRLLTPLTCLNAAAVCYERAGANDLALACARSSLKLDWEPLTFALSRSIIARIMCRRGELEKAKEEYVQVKAIANECKAYMAGVTAISDAIVMGAIAEDEGEAIILEFCNKMGAKRQDYQYLFHDGPRPY
jgi:hypothetical protein